MDRWPEPQPINTAPKDGTRLLISDGDSWWVAEWNGDGWEFGVIIAGDWNYRETVYLPLFWMPLPPLPRRTITIPADE